MKLFTGCDIVRIARFADHLADTRFLDHCFSRAEQDYCFSCALPAQHLAARFAGKEAVLKALSGMGVRYDIRQIEIINEPSGRPSVRFHGPAVSDVQMPDKWTADISLSHDGEYAMATAIVYLLD